jgi:Fe-S cluster biogenesis protein NfuA
MKTLEEVQAMLDANVNTLLGQHRGRVEISSIDRDPKDMSIHVTTAYVKMIGGCKGCTGAKYTLNMLVATQIKNFDITIDNVVDITDHADKTDAFFKE